MGATIKVNASAAISGLNDLQQRALPYALAATLTGLAYDSRDQLISDLPQRMKFRTGTGWLRYNFRVNPADKTSLRATFYSILDYMYLHEYTGIKTPHRGPHLAVPLGDLRNKKIPPNLRPKFLLGQDFQGLLTAASLKGKRSRQKRIATFGKGFIFNANGKTFIVQRTSQGRRGLTFLYVLVPAVYIGLDRLQMVDTTARVVSLNFGAKFTQNLERISLKFSR